MTFAQTDLRALRRSSQSSDRTRSSPSTSSGDAAPVPRPRARWATRLLIPTAVLLATGGILAYAARDVFQPRLAVHVAAAIPKTVATIAIAESDVPATTATVDDASPAVLGPVAVQAPGWIEPAPFAVNVPVLAEGVVKEVLVLEGERIEVGQVVARLIDDDARLAVRVVEAMLNERAADVDRAKAAVATAEAQVHVERIAVDELRDEITRKRELVGLGGVSAGDFRRMEIRLGGLEARVVTAERAADEAKAVLGQATAALAASQVAKDEASLRIARMEVRSPIAGVVLARLVEPGSRISIGAKGGESAAGSALSGAVLRVYDPAKLQVRVDVPLADAAKIGVGTRAVVTTEALADQTFTGVVSRVVHEANIQRNTVQFKVTLDAPSPVLKPEMLTRVKLHAAPSSRAARSNAASDNMDASDLSLLVPSSAVTAVGDNKGSVWVVDSSSGSSVARRRDVTLDGASLDEGFTVIVAGLRVTDRVIIDAPPSPAIHDGTRIRVLGERTPAAHPVPATP